MRHGEFDYGGLGYVGVGAPDPLAWRRFATDVCGLMPARVLPPTGSAAPRAIDASAEGVAPDGTVYLKMDDRQWRLAVHPRPEATLEYLGFELRSDAAFTRLCEAIAKRGAALHEGTAEECRARCVGRLAVVHDPAGHRLELFTSPVRDRDFVSPRGTTFKTQGLGMGHVVLYVPDIEAALEFYRDVLGFVRSDFMAFGPNGMGIHFLRCTPRHHSVALLHLADLTGLQHLMLETMTLDDVGKALDRALAAEVPITSSLGRHRNDGTVSFYMRGPSGFEVEIGWDGLLVGDDWIENEFAGGGDDWGHHGLDAESLMPGGKT